MTVSIENAEHYVWGDGCDGWHLVNSPDLSVIQERMPPDTAEARHAHARSRQFFYVLRGKADLEVEGARHHLVAGQGLEVPPNVPHQLFNPGPGTLEFLVVSQAHSHGDRIISQS